MHRYFKRIGNTDYISEWKSKGLSDEIIKPPSTKNNSLAPALSYFRTKTRVKFNGSGLTISWNNSKHIHCLLIKFKS